MSIASSATVLTGGDGGNYSEIFKALAGKYIDMMDVHFFGFVYGDYRGGQSRPAGLSVLRSETGAVAGDAAGGGGLCSG